MTKAMQIGIKKREACGRLLARGVQADAVKDPDTAGGCAHQDEARRMSMLISRHALRVWIRAVGGHVHRSHGDRDSPRRRNK